MSGLSFDALMALPLDELGKLAVIEAVEEGKRAEVQLAVTGELWRCLLERQARLEAKVDAVIVALRGGAVGKWS